jgi:hypothetical protein
MSALMINKRVSTGLRTFRGSKMLSGIVASILLLCGCGAGAVSAVRGKAAEDMPCAEDAVKVTPATPNGSTVFYAEGCKQVRRYHVNCNTFGLCGTPEGVNARELVQRQAAFDLKCDGSNVAVERLNTDTFGATGCDRQVSYVLLCTGQDCRVVQNTQSQ